MNKPREGLSIDSDYVHTVRTYLGSTGVRSGKGRGARGERSRIGQVRQGDTEVGRPATSYNR